MDLEQQLDNATGTLVALGTDYGVRVIGAIVILALGWIAARFVYRAIARLCAKSRRLDLTVTYFLANVARYGVLVFTFVAVLTTFGIATTSFVAVLGALGLAIGLALQGTLSNFAAGIMLILFRPFHVDDVIETGSVSGRLRMINLFYSELDTEDNVRVVIPNGKLWGEIVRIPTRNDRRRLDLRIQRPANDDVQSAIGRMRDVLAHDRRVSDIASVGVESLTDSGYMLAARIWVDQRDLPDLHLELNRAVKEEFERRPPAAMERRAASASLEA
jgi:small conductance mechanosensitive channel